nr:immunoglobulin heavy chain junction region [Mus musculus]
CARGSYYYGSSYYWYFDVW